MRESPDKLLEIRTSVNVAESQRFSTGEKDLIVHFQGAHHNVAQHLTIPEAERLYYKLRWSLQEFGRVPLGPFLWKVVVKTTGPYDYETKKSATKTVGYYILATTEEEIHQNMHRLIGHHGGLSFISITKEMNADTLRVALISEEQMAKDDVKAIALAARERVKDAKKKEEKS